ncbi:MULTISPECIES: hydrogenase maturation protease [Caloramator]|uniref:Hydrogenase maturation protease n=1 Tax=Caloramator proteoclasticus DSM 10124 TaxID=1121262 RepID=A0A1M4UU42_9CLOT|nr:MULTISPECIES: hydrogenase maturation protease [Caloramator]SHE60281.1 hydrogenase maturation protease [Caloramator proteoclasticus DSM 10124]
MKTILCIGNILMQDDGIGIVIGHILRKKGIDCIICETDIAFINEVLNSYDDVIVVDAVDFNLPAGSSIIIPQFEYKPFYNFHHDILFYKYKKITLYGIQVESIGININISKSLRSNLKLYVDEIIKLYNSK